MMFCDVFLKHDVDDARKKFKFAAFADLKN